MNDYKKDTLKSMVFAMAIAVIVIVAISAISTKLKNSDLRNVKAVCSVCGSSNLRFYSLTYQSPLDYTHRQYRRVFYCYDCNKEYDISMLNFDTIPDEKSEVRE